jgi:hypothetical protein
MKYRDLIFVLFLIAPALIFTACSNSSNQKVTVTNDSTATMNDSATISIQDTAGNSTTISSSSDSANKITASSTDQPTVHIYNFYITNRCVSCIAIEEATTKTLNTYFSAEVKQGRIKRQILNVDEDANKSISEKYQAFGSGLFVTRVFKGKETTTDLTGDGFKYAKNKEEKFIEILKNKITEYLK